MADPIRPLRLGMVIWFGSLEFISLGQEYDLVLLPPRAPRADDGVAHQQPGRRRHPGRRSRHARQPRREHDHPDTARPQGDMPRSVGIPCPAVGTRSLVGDLSGLSLGRGKTPVTRSDAPSSSSAPPPPEEPTTAEQGPAMAPSPYPFGLRNAAAAYASAHMEPSGRHRRFSLDFSTATLTHTHCGSSEEDETWAGAYFSGLRNLEAMRRFLAASDYCFSYSDSDDEGTYDPTRECFHIGLRMPGANNENEGAGNRSPL